MMIMLSLVLCQMNVLDDNDGIDDDLSVNGKADNDQEIAEGCHHYANLIRMMIMTMITVMGSTAMETAMSTVRNMPKGAGQQEGPQS